MQSLHQCVCVHVCMHQCVCNYPKVSDLGGEHSCQTSPTVSPGTIYVVWFVGTRACRLPEPRYCSVLISSAFRSYLDPICFFQCLLFIHMQTREKLHFWKTAPLSTQMSYICFVVTQSIGNLWFCVLFLGFDDVSTQPGFFAKCPRAVTRLKEKVISFLYLVFLSLRFSAKQWQACREWPERHRLSGFSGIQVVIDWRLAHGWKPQRDSATLAKACTSMHWTATESW